VAIFVLFFIKDYICLKKNYENQIGSSL